MPASELSGLMVLDKPVGPTSRDAVDRAMQWFPRKTPVGHTGTLDPLASGVLVLCVGSATRLAEYVQNMPKTYIADLILGGRSRTDDAEGPIVSQVVQHPPNRATLEDCLATFLGKIEQVPPAFSAAKVAGTRAYALARRGGALQLPARTVTVHSIDILDFEYPRLRIEVRCGKGTYVRALARDLGDRLGCGAYLGGLRRTRVGPFTPIDATPLDVGWVKEPKATTAHRLRTPPLPVGLYRSARSTHPTLLPPAAAIAELPRATVSSTAASAISHGRSVRIDEAVPADVDVAVFDSTGALIAIAVSDDQGKTLRPTKVFPA